MAAWAGAILVAAGRGERMGGTVAKQFLPLGGMPVYGHALAALERHPLIGPIVVVAPDDAVAELKRAVTDAHPNRGIKVVAGAVTRQGSVAAGLAALDGEGVAPDAPVLVHDAARPFLPESLVTRAVAAALRHGAAVPALAVADTIKVVDADGRVVGTPDRAALRAVQTPQAFRFDLLRRAHREASGDGSLDDASLVEALGHPVHVFEGAAETFKLTTPADMERARQSLGASWQPRTGIGFDVHAFGPGDHVMVGGVVIAHDRGLLGHSDADVALHALTDAVLGALADGDIGSHFPPTDPRWKGMASEMFLRHALGLLAQRGGRLTHLDITVLCEAPRIGPHRAAIAAQIAAIAGLSPGAVGVKATTTERLGFTGRGEGMAALATATVLLPEETP